MRVKRLIPDPFVLANGERITSRDQWERWRQETRELVLELEYGTMPGAPGATEVKEVETQAAEGVFTYKKLQFRFIPDERHPDAHFSLDASLRVPAPAVVGEVRADLPHFGEGGIPCVVYVGTHPCWELLERGYAVLNFQNDQLEPMKMGNPVVGPAQATYEKLEPGAYSWGSIAVWAWGAMRMVDYLLSLPEVHPDQLVITGHSRNGKTALLAGALDDRIAVVNPAGSGCGGAGSYLVLGEGCEDIAALTDTRRWWAWMHPDFATYGYREENLFFDQHFLMGLVAPRPLLRTEGMRDEWANPVGTAAAFLATEEIYKFLGVPERNQLALRPGGHTQNHADMLALLAVANATFFGVPQDRIFKDLACDFAALPPIMDWTCPAGDGPGHEP